MLGVLVGVVKVVIVGDIGNGIELMQGKDEERKKEIHINND